MTSVTLPCSAVLVCACSLACVTRRAGEHDSHASRVERAPADHPSHVAPVTTSEVAHEIDPLAPFRPALQRFASGDAPLYPELSRRLGEEGWVELALDVAHGGELVTVSISKSRGSDRLEASALAAARTWRFLQRTGPRGIERLYHRVVFRLDSMN